MDSSHDPTTDPEDEAPKREAWQVVGCPQCKVPAGMRCTGLRMITHGMRKKAFAAKQEEDDPSLSENRRTGEESRPRKTDRSRDAGGSGAPDDFSSRRERSAQRQRHQRDQGVAQPDGKKYSGKSRKYKADQTDKNERTRLPKKEHSDSQTHDDWSILASRLRAQNQRDAPQASPPSLAPATDYSPSSKRPTSSIPNTMSDSFAEPAEAPFGTNNPLDSLGAISALDATLHGASDEPNTFASRDVTTGTGDLSAFDRATPTAQTAQSGPLQFRPKLENPLIWQLNACPLCRAPSGQRCFTTLGQPRFASHSQRVEAHRKATEDGC